MALTDYLIDKKDFSTARTYIEKGLSTIPDNEDLLSAYANLLYYHFEKSLSLIPYNRLIELYPNSPEYLALRGNTYLDLNLNDLAMRDYKKANELAGGKQSWILANIGNLMKNSGFFREAIKYLKMSLEINPESQYSHDRLAAAIKSRDEQVNKLKNILKDAKRLMYTDKTEDDSDEKQPNPASS